MSEAVSDPTSVDLVYGDRMRYERNGEMDWPRLLADRSNTYTGGLRGVMSSDEGFDVLYGREPFFTCVSVSADLRQAHLHEANCVPSGRIVRMSDTSLSCD